MRQIEHEPLSSLRYILYKLPAIKWREVPDNINNGSAYAYLDNKNLDFTLSPTRITSPDSVAGQTLNQVYKAFEDDKTPSDQAHVFYNDAKPLWSGLVIFF